MTPVKYIGHRETFIDGCYGSKVEFVKGESKLLDDPLANKLLRHPDQFVRGSDNVHTVAELPVIEHEDTQDLRDTIAIMDKAALIEFAQNTYRIKLDARSSEDALRAKTIELVDQYGIA